MHPVSSFVRRFILAAAVVTAIAAALAPACAQAAAVRSVGIRMVASIVRDDTFVKFSEPAALVFDENKKRLYVADSGNSRLVSFDSEFKYLSEFADEGVKLPVSVARLSDGNFVVTDGSKGEIRHIDLKQKKVMAVELKNIPAAADKFFPGRFALDSKDRLYVIDRLNRRIIVAGMDGGFISAMTVKDKGFYGFNDIKLDAKGNIFALDTLGATVYVFDSSGVQTSKFSVDRKGLDGTSNGGFPSSIAVGPKGDIYVLDRHIGNIAVYNPTGTIQYTLSRRGVDYGEHYSPSYIAIDGQGRIFTIDGNRVQIFVENKEEKKGNE